jgi:hypothetical protein
MAEIAQIIAATGIPLSAIFLGLARLRMADAYRTWARRCDPTNPGFPPPLDIRGGR